ncbi:hypothetical protein EG328_007405 [Venturia inaequalis]|uniref:Uncharacterized protein n=1 Tax=Venturia inaequalis TaxID=5025 RepID=A0A8H3VI23_VENIN|nr:hypothetical protein EG328_007405 [Venturia inaequalis]KAE9993413.1 hypothetical protein EG327_005184 [Venturia inaequalis]
MASQDGPSQSTPLPYSNNQTFPLLKLPRELRNKIYRSVLVHDYYLAPSCYYMERSIVEQMSASPRIRSIKADTQMFCVSQQIHDEAREVFLNNNVFEYQETYDSFRRGPTYGIYKIPRKFQVRSFEGSDAIKNARRIVANFGGRNDMIADFVNLLVQNQHLRSLDLSFDNMTASLLIVCQKALPQLEAIKVRDSVDFDFRPRYYRFRTKLQRERDFEAYLGVLKEKMLAK